MQVIKAESICPNLLQTSQKLLLFCAVSMIFFKNNPLLIKVKIIAADKLATSRDIKFSCAYIDQEREIEHA